MHIQLPGLNMAYDLAGSGRPLLFMHGYPLGRGMWQPQLEALAGDMQLIAPDLRGHGETEAPPGPYSIEGIAADCLALLDALNISQPVVVAGLSMGGYAALAFQRQFPARTAALILAATRAGADSAEGRTGRDRAAALAREKGAEAIIDSMLPKMLAPQHYTSRPELAAELRAIMQATGAEGMQGTLMAMRDRPDATPLLASIDVPALVLHGLEDQIIPHTEAEAMAQRLKNSRLALVADAGHLLNMEQPEAFNAHVREFVAGL